MEVSNGIRQLYKGLFVNSSFVIVTRMSNAKSIGSSLAYNIIS